MSPNQAKQTETQPCLCMNQEGVLDALSYAGSPLHASRCASYPGALCGWIGLGSRRNFRKMGDRHSDSSYDGKIEEVEVAIKIDVKTIQQLSSSAEAAKANRGKQAILALDNAARRAKEEEEKREATGGNENKKEGEN
ncbi:hypothetical protein EMCG_09349 [[Emmonsia] crescens]|uniref:Uncharacterized protein n=1 Tax=[Emmonsia] crescens TaxID=73230 RepID=A0A0G2I3F2_9EURO|nr:hypothetical protein EMCG_09349 [Emmonsia crescens UAMH 3008]